MDADVVSGLLQSVRKEDPRRRRLESLESGASKRPPTRGCGGAGPSAALPLSDVSTASPASRRLASDPAALASRPPTGKPPAVGNAGFAGGYPLHTLFQQPAARRALRVVPADRPRLQRGGLDLHLDFVPLVLPREVGRVVGEQILAAQLLVDLPIDGVQVLGRVDVEGLTPAGVCELVQLVLDLEVRSRDSKPDPVDRDARLAHVLERRVVVELGGRVLAVRHENEGLLPLYPGALIQAEDDRVIERGGPFRAQARHGTVELVFAIRELAQDVGLVVE